MSYKLFLSILLCLIVTKATAQRDTLFWFAAPEVSVHNANFDKPIRFFITTYNLPATVTITQPAGGGMPAQTATIAANGSHSIDVTPWINVIENTPADAVLNYGLKLHSTAPVTVYYEVVSAQCQCNPEIFPLKGKNALGTDFYIPSQNYVYNNNSYSPAPNNSFDIVATDNNTTVTITPSNNVVGHSSGIPYTITLNAGQTYSAAATGTTAAAHLSGSRVSSNKPIAITEKDDLITGSYGTCADLAGDQIVPVNIVGQEYIAISGNLNAPYDQLFITATQNNTSITKDGTLLSTINAGQTYRIQLNTASSYIQTSAPAYLFQLTGLGCELGTAMLPSLICTGSNKVSVARSTHEDFYITLLVRSGGQGNFLVNGLPGIVTAAQFTAVPATANQWYAAKVILSSTQFPQNSVISVTNSTHLFHMGMLHGGALTGSRFGYFSNYGLMEPEIETDDSICVGETIGLKTSTLAGATYSWTGPAGFTSNQQNPSIPNATKAMSGIYTLTVSMSTCSATKSLNIVVSDKPAVNILQKDTSICGGSITLTATGASSYIWSPATGLNTTSGATVTASPTSNITYTVTGTDQNGCEGSDNVTIGIKPATVIVATPEQDTICENETATFAASGGVVYAWSPATGLNSTTGATVTASPANTTTYIVEGTDAAGCSGKDTVTVYVGKAANVAINLSLCSDTSIRLGELTIKDPGVYEQKISTTLGCDSIITLTLSYKERPKAGFTYMPVTPVLNEPSTFNNTSTNATNYYWSFGDNKYSTERDPVHMFPKTGTYNVCLTAISTDSCVDKVCHDVKAEVRNSIGIPTGFSPNGDGKNDILYVRGAAIAEMHLKIYNRWGQMIFESKSLEKGWDGTYSGQDQDIDVVAYVLHAVFLDGSTYSNSGNITLLK